MNLSVGEIVSFGPPGLPKVRGKVVKLGHPKVKIRQLVAGHGQAAGTTWWVPVSAEYITQTFGGAAGRASVPVSEGGRYHPPKRSSRPPAPRRSSRPPPAPKSTASGLSEAWAINETIALLKKWNVPLFHVKFSNAQTRALGKVNYRTRIIGYSRPLWARATDEERRTVVIHEVAHAVVENREGRRAGVSHGTAWKKQMVAMGIGSPSAYHTIDRTGLQRRRSDAVEMSCCGKKFGVTLKKVARMVARIEGGDIYFRNGVKCRPCGEEPTIRRSDVPRVIEFMRRGEPLRPNQICGCGRGH